MKKVILLTLTFIGVFMLGACSNSDDNSDTEILSSEESLATLSYLSAGFMDFESTPTVNSSIAFLSVGNNDSDTEIEEELDEVNIYIDRLKGLIDNGVDSFGSVAQEDSDNDLYEYKLTFTVNDEVYIIYYNIDAITYEMTGVIVIGEVEYDFEVVNNMHEYQYEYEHQTGEVNQDDNSNEESSEDDLEENESKMILIARNGDDMIKIMYKTEIEDDEETIKFDMEQNIDGVEKEVKLKISSEADKYKIMIEDGDDRYTFKRDTENEEDGEVVYKLNYQVDGVTGMVKIKVITDTEGNVSYDYHITEAGKNKHIQKDKPKSKGFDDDDTEENEL